MHGPHRRSIFFRQLSEGDSRRPLLSHRGDVVLAEIRQCRPPQLHSTSLRMLDPHSNPLNQNRALKGRDAAQYGEDQHSGWSARIDRFVQRYEFDAQDLQRFQDLQQMRD